ncbi:MAG: carbohydrate binding family 9 domain-containing protein, partial [Gemmatimonadota bacterium]|nr:carbohydrate binding family 9 domain-containing protein [Gemmatimonadota bacterium]
MHPRCSAAAPLRAALTVLAALLVLPAAGAAQSVTAVRTDEPVILDGFDGDEVWRSAPVISDFSESRPSEGATPKQRTEFRVAYDPHNLYVFVRAYDTHPDSIVQLLSRRDDQTESDQVIVMIDSYRDRRTGYEFVVNPAGVKADYAIYNDGNEDGAWDAVWDVATDVDSLGWTAEYRIPFSQLRFAAADTVTFGFLVWRTLQRHTSQLTWPLYRPSQTGFVSQFGELTGLAGLARPRRAEVVPYLLTQNEPLIEPGGIDRRQRLSVGGDLKYAVASNLTLTATVNPDFGQVEADPAVLNLSAFETFFSERRPFFVAGAGLFDFRVNCFVVVDCNTGENLFYSRRIGRAPRLAGRYGDASSPTATRILGAAKLSGRLPNGFSIGFLDAVTDRENGAADATIEPTTNYAVLRANQDYAQGNGSVGVILTGVHRSLDEWTQGFLHKDAYAGGVDARRRLGRFEVSGSLMASRVSGTPEAIALTQREPVHYYQRPDDELAFDPTRTSLSGYSGELRFAKVAGRRTVFETGYGRRSEGFDVNDLGFLRRANEQTWTNWFALRFNEPNAVFQRLNWNFNWWQYWTLEGLPTDRAFNTNVHTQFNNRWWLHLGGTIGVGRVYCDRNCTRGGPALEVEPGFSPWMGIEGDGRRGLVPSLWINYSRNDGGRSQYYNINPGLRLNVSTRFSTTLSLNYSRNDDDSQWFGNFTDGGGVEHFTFAELNQKTLGVTWRLNYTFTPTTSLQVYANPFVSKGEYSRVREVAEPRADEYEDRFQPYDDPVAENPGGFN